MSRAAVSSLRTADATLARIERAAAGAFCALVFVLITANVVVRALRIPVFWIDEAAVYAMVWMAFLAASAAIQSNQHIAVTLVVDALPESLARQARRLSNLIVLALGLACLALSWMWFDPIGLIQSGGDMTAFSDRTLNFIYTEPTVSFTAPKVLFWLIMPIFSAGITFHACVRLIAEWDAPLPPTSNREVN
ncbi:MAG: TRAP transporter small permease subunit [Hyphomonadaceae bacterium]|nr:TRAP transporter small permease subunit [Hyphomonadaceae bacterium]